MDEPQKLPSIEMVATLFCYTRRASIANSNEVLDEIV